MIRVHKYLSIKPLAGLGVAFALGAFVGVNVAAQTGHRALYGGARPLAPYSPAVDTGDAVYLSGQVGMNAETGELHDGVRAQARQALNNLHNLLTEAGLSKSNVVRATVYLDDIDNYGALNEVYGEFFDAVEVKPSRSTVGVAALPLGAAVEIDFIAVR